MMSAVRRSLAQGRTPPGHPSAGRRACELFLKAVTASAFSPGVALEGRRTGSKPFFSKVEPAVQDKVDPAVQDKEEPAVEDKGFVPAGDGFDDLRQEISSSAPAATREAKFDAVLAVYLEREKNYLRLYKEARDKGDTVKMDTWQCGWKETTASLDMLRSDPDKFIKKYGW